jgi:universal stress protein A
MAISQILMPVDYSEASKAAVDYAGFIAKHLGAALHIIHVWDRPAYVADTFVVTPGGGKPRSLADMIRENAEAEMKEFLESCQVPKDVPVTSHLESGEPASTILKVAQTQGVDLVIVGTHGRTGVRHLLLGSIAEKVVRLSPVPVLTVPPGERTG